MIIRPLTIMAPRPTPPTPPVVDEVQIGNQIWKTFYLNIDDGQGDVRTLSYYNDMKFYTNTDADRIIEANYPGFRRAIISDYTNMFYYTLGSTGPLIEDLKKLYVSSSGGTDEYGLHLKLNPLVYENSSGTQTTMGTYDGEGWPTWSNYFYSGLWCNATRPSAGYKSQSNIGFRTMTVSNVRSYDIITPYYAIRLVKDAT